MGDRHPKYQHKDKVTWEGEGEAWVGATVIAGAYSWASDTVTYTIETKRGRRISGVPEWELRAAT
jgi:hypothetical protein